MNKTKPPAEKDVERAAPVMIGLTRSSSQEVAEGYGPDIQADEITGDSERQHYALQDIHDIVEPATIDLEERDLFNGVLAEAALLKKRNKCDGLVFSRCDRLSRRFDTALQIALDAKKNGLALRFVREDQWLKPDDEPLQLVMFVLQAFGVHTQSRISFANMNAGRLRAAAEGKLPSGVGKGMLGYTLSNRKFEANSFINIVEQLLQASLHGESINQITRGLRSKDVRTPRGNLITRTTVANVLRHARRYAGVWEWGGYEIRGLIPARISEEQAGYILDNLKRNQQKSLGYGKRKWLTSRVICGLCGHRYKLGTNNGCSCKHSDPLLFQPACRNVKVRWKWLSNEVWDLFINCLTNLDALELTVADKRKAWKARKKEIDRQVSALNEQLLRLEKKRRLYSWQHAEGMIADEDLRISHKQLKSEESIIREQLNRVEQFRKEPAPMDMAAFRRLAEYWTADIAGRLYDAPDELRAKFAERFDLFATIHPDKTGRGYHVDLSANIPLEKDGAAYDMVFSPSGRG